jgi:dihydrolipoamide dehydrogenase
MSSHHSPLTTHHLNQFSYDIVIVGSGPGGYTAAVHAAKRGAAVAIIEKDSIGGICLNAGCIPTKTLLASAKLLNDIQKKAPFLGINVTGAGLDFTKVLARKDRVVTRLGKGLERLFSQHKITVLKGKAVFSGGHTVSVNGEEIGFKKLIWAAGSVPKALKDIPFGGRVLSSTEVLALKEKPGTLTIIGGGVIGIEMATVFSIAGTKVTVIELEPEILPGVDPEAAALVRAGLERLGVTFQLKTTISSYRTDVAQSGLLLTLSNGQTLAAEYVLNAVGRSIDLSDIKTSDVKLTAKGAIKVNDRLETSVRDVYAIGDVTGLSWLAHGAAYQGEIAAENAAGGKSSCDLSAIPSCIYSIPEIAFVGITDPRTTAGSVCRKVPLNILGKMQTDGENEGFIKVYSQKKTGIVEGVIIVGPHASELLAEGTLACRLGLTEKDLGKVIRPHPSLTEIYNEVYMPLFS